MRQYGLHLCNLRPCDVAPRLLAKAAQIASFIADFSKIFCTAGEGDWGEAPPPRVVAGARPCGFPPEPQPNPPPIHPPNPPPKTHHLLLPTLPTRPYPRVRALTQALCAALGRSEAEVLREKRDLHIRAAAAGRAAQEAAEAMQARSVRSSAGMLSAFVVCLLLLFPFPMPAAKWARVASFFCGTDIRVSVRACPTVSARVSAPQALATSQYAHWMRHAVGLARKGERRGALAPCPCAPATLQMDDSPCLRGCRWLPRWRRGRIRVTGFVYARLPPEIAAAAQKKTRKRRHLATHACPHPSAGERGSPAGAAASSPPPAPPAAPRRRRSPRRSSPPRAAAACRRSTRSRWRAWRCWPWRGLCSTRSGSRTRAPRARSGGTSACSSESPVGRSNVASIE